MDLKAIARCSAHPWIISWFAAVLVSLSFVPLPRQPFVLDDSLSEKTVLSYAYENGWRYGKDIVFTYGPWGYLVTRHFFPRHHAVQMMVLTCLSFLTSLGVCLVAWQTRFLWRSLLLGIFIYLTANIDPRGDLLLYSAILVWAWLCIHTNGKPLLFCICCFCVAAVFGVMVKANFLLSALLSTAMIFTNCLFKSRFGVAGGLLPALSAMFVAAWMLSGQNISDLSSFFAHSYSIIRGYDQVVGFDAPSIFVRRALWVLVLAVAATVTRMIAMEPGAGGIPISRARWHTGALSLWLFLFIFILWKHGFVRADLYHMGFFFGLIPLLVLCLELVPSSSGTARLVSRIFTLACCALTVVTLNTLFFSSFKASLVQPVAGFKENITDLLRPGGYQRREQEQYNDAEKAARLPRLTAAIGNSSVDVFGQRQCYGVLNKLNYHCRPVFQSYLAFNEQLAGLNEAFYLSSAAPEFVLFELTTSDHRFPPMEDSLLFRHLLLNGKPLLEEKPFLLLEVKSSNPATLTLVHEDIAPLEGRVMLPQESEELLWVEILVEPGLLGRLLHLMSKPPTLRLSFWEKNGKTPLVRAQAPAPMLACGFVASPLLVDTKHVKEFLDGSHGIRPFSFSLEVAPAAKRYWKPNFRYKVYQVQRREQNRADTHAPASAPRRENSSFPCALEFPLL